MDKNSIVDQVSLEFLQVEPESLQPKKVKHPTFCCSASSVSNSRALSVILIVDTGGLQQSYGCSRQIFIKKCFQEQAIFSIAASDANCEHFTGCLGG